MFGKIFDAAKPHYYFAPPQLGGLAYYTTVAASYRQSNAPALRQGEYAAAQINITLINS